eukprot:165648-Pelagomonas_calceolata.AAC.4
MLRTATDNKRCALHRAAVGIRGVTKNKIAMLLSTEQLPASEEEILKHAGFPDDHHVDWSRTGRIHHHRYCLLST